MCPVGRSWRTDETYLTVKGVWECLCRVVPTLEDAIELIDWSGRAGKSRSIFNVLKNGCRVEALQRSAIDRIERR